MRSVRALRFACGEAVEPSGPLVCFTRDDFARKHGEARRAARGDAQAAGLLAWGRQYLPAHFTRPPSLMHRWLAEALQAMHQQRGSRLNVLGPRGAAKSTIGTLAFALRAALEGWEPYIWIVSDTRHQACAHLENIKAELLDNRLLAADYPQAVGRGPVWRAGGDRAPQRRGHRGLRHRAAASAAGATAPIAPRSSSATTCRTTATSSRPCSASTRGAGSTAR